MSLAANMSQLYIHCQFNCCHLRPQATEHAEGSTPPYPSVNIILDGLKTTCIQVGNLSKSF